jgi:hypothetical protein
MVDIHKGTPIIELYLVSFDESKNIEVNDYNNDDVEDDGVHERIERDDPYWDEVYELY